MPGTKKQLARGVSLPAGIPAGTGDLPGSARDCWVWIRRTQIKSRSAAPWSSSNIPLVKAAPKLTN